MCLSIPAKIIAIKNDDTAIAAVQGVECTISIQLLDDVKEGDYVLIHTGFALQKLDEVEAQEGLELLKKLSDFSNSR